jgi:hypothetical protein
MYIILNDTLSVYNTIIYLALEMIWCLHNIWNQNITSIYSSCILHICIMDVLLSLQETLWWISVRFSDKWNYVTNHKYNFLHLGRIELRGRLAQPLEHKNTTVVIQHHYTMWPQQEVDLFQVVYTICLVTSSGVLVTVTTTNSVLVVTSDF